MRIGRPAFRGGRTISAGGGGAPARAPQPQPVAQSWPPAQQQVSRTGSSDSGSGSGSDEEGGGPAGSSDGGRPVSGSSSGDSSATTASVVHEANERIYRLSEQLANAEKRAEAAEAAANRAAAVAGPLESRCAELESDLESKIGLLSTTQQQLRMAEEEARAERGALPSSSLLQTVENLRAENDALKAAAGVSGVAAATAVAVDAPVAIVQLAPGEKGPTRALEDEAEDMLFYSGQLEELREELKEAEEQCDVYRQQHSELQAALLVAHKQATPTKQAENLSESITAPWSTPRRQQQAQQQRAVLCEAGDENEDRLGDGAATMAMVEKLKEELNYFRQENSRLKIEMQQSVDRKYKKAADLLVDAHNKPSAGHAGQQMRSVSASWAGPSSAVPVASSIGLLPSTAQRARQWPRRCTASLGCSGTPGRTPMRMKAKAGRWRHHLAGECSGRRLTVSATPSLQHCRPGRFWISGAG